MNPDLLLSWLKSNSSIKRVRAARGFKRERQPKYLKDLQIAFQQEEVPWVRKALAAVLQEYSSSHESSLKSPDNSRTLTEVDIEESSYEEIQSAAINDSIGQMLHEIEPVIGAVKVVAKEEISDYPNSNLKGEIDRLDELLEMFERWRSVEKPPKIRPVNIYQLISNEVARVNKNSSCRVEIAVVDDLSFDSDSSMLAVVFGNTIKNAVESTQEIEPDKRRPIVVSAGVSEKGLWGSVLDGGVGLSPNEKLTLSSRHSTKPGHRGMGLAVVHKAITTLGGKWDLTNGRSRGAQFYFEILGKLPG